MAIYAHKDEGRDLDRLGDYYIKHVEAMTTENLYLKSAIAAELAYRDYRIDELKGIIESVRQNSFQFKTLVKAALKGKKLQWKDYYEGWIDIDPSSSPFFSERYVNSWRVKE